MTSCIRDREQHIRQRYWITNIHSAVKSYVRKCTPCKKIAGLPYRTPISPPIQKWRVDETPPFSITGVYYTGELLIGDNNGPRKVYICLFTCAVTRAIHLEAVNDLSSNKFLLAFRRFASRRSLTIEIDQRQRYIFHSCLQSTP